MFWFDLIIDLQSFLLLLIILQYNLFFYVSNKNKNWFAFLEALLPRHTQFFSRHGFFVFLKFNRCTVECAAKVYHSVTIYKCMQTFFMRKHWVDRKP